MPAYNYATRWVAVEGLVVDAPAAPAEAVPLPRLSGEPAAVVESIIAAARQGTRVFVDEKLLERMPEVRELFEKLGVRLREVEPPRNGGAYVLLRYGGAYIKVQVYSGGRLVDETNIGRTKFIDALRALVEKRRPKPDTPRVYEIILPEEAPPLEEDDV